MADVFISYKSERRAAAEHLAEILVDYGYSVWWDYGLISGRDFGSQIEKELRAAKAVVVLWCSMSVGSEWVREEAALAKRLDRVIPTFIEKNVDLPLGFSLSQTLDLADWDGSPKSAKLDRLLRDIGAFVGRAPKPNMEGLERTERAWRLQGEWRRDGDTACTTLAVDGGVLTFTGPGTTPYPEDIVALDEAGAVRTDVAGTPATYARDGDALLFTYGSDGPALRYDPCAD